MANLADIFGGGKDTAAQDVLTNQLANINAIPTPTPGQLTLPQLQQYVVAGILTPAQAQAYLSGQTAFTGTTADNAGMGTELQTIGELQNIVNQGGNDPEAQAAIQAAVNQMNTTEAGNNAAILNQAAQRGTSTSGLVQAGQLAGNQNEATNANTNALNAAAAGQARQLAAIQGAGTMGGAVQGQEYTQAANQANATDAINKFNATQDQTNSQFNTTLSEEAKAANLANAQNVGNLNTQSAQLQEESIPAAQEQAFQNALAKASAGTTAAENLANQETQTGQQNAGISGGGISALGTVGAAALTGNPYAALATALLSQNTPNTNTSTTSTTNSAPATGASGGKVTTMGIQPPMNMKMGGLVPGRPLVPGNSPINDTVKARLTPGEVVLPNTVTQPTPDPAKVLNFLRSLPKPPTRPQVHPKAVADTLRALNGHYSGGNV